ncbi:MAG: SusC/RagA family TonB-linked outer membrane protein [Bacteroidota bacterium]
MNHLSTRRTIYLLFFQCLFLTSLSAQQLIKGQVSSEEEGPLIGVNVTIKGSSLGTTSDLDGNFEIEVANDQAVLVFSYIGYIDQEVPIAGQQNLNVTLQSDAQQLDEVVVTALNIKRQKRELGYSTESFDGDEVALSNAPDVVNALSGKSAGVQVSSPNGVDGGTTRIVIRGNNNINANNQPLIVVDGVPLDNEPGLENIGRGVDWGSAINNINPLDIEDMNILKGPTASALYGARGANGVILITTKRGRKQKGIGVSYSVQHKIIQPYRYRDVQNTYGAGGPISLLEPTLPQDDEGNFLYPRANHSDNGPFGKSTFETFGFYSTGVSWGPRMEGQMVQWWDGETRPFDPQPDNLKLYFQNGHTTTHNLSFSGGGKLGTTRLSLTRTDHEAIVPNSGFDQTTINLGSNLSISSKVTADLAISYVNFQRQNSPTLGDDNDNSFGKGILYSWPRSYKGLEREINVNPDGTRNNYDGQYPFTFAPPHLWWNTYNNTTELDRNKLIGALSLTYEITDWLSATGRLGMDFTLNQFEERRNPTDLVGITDGYYGNELERNMVRNNEFLINARKDKIFQSPINASLSLGGTQWKRRRYGLRAAADRWVNPWLFSFENYGDEPPPITEVRFDKDINSLYAFLNLSYDNFLFLEMTGRNDWSSALPNSNNSYFYPSASLSFILTEALNLKWGPLSFLKLRGAYAQTASDTDPFQLDFTYQTSTFGGNQTAALPTTIPPIGLRPQQANSYEVGLNAGFFNDKINLDFTYYQINSFDQILDAPLPASSGANEIRINSGELENKGIEATLSIDVLRKRHFFIQTSFNIARNRNRVVSLGDGGAKVLELADIWGLNGPAIAVREGEDYGTIVGYDYIYHEETGQPILAEGGTHYLISENRVPVGNASPDFTGGWSIRMGFKGLTLRTLVDTKWGGDIYAGSYVIGLQTGQSPETLVERNGGGLPYTDPAGNTRNVGVVLDGVYADGTVNQEVVHYYFKYVPNAGGWGRFLSKPGILDNSWVKLREVSLAYEVPKGILGKARIFQDLTVSLVGRDLFYIYTSLPDRINPEGSNGSGNAQGLEWASFPGSRSITFGLNAAF